MQKEEFLQLAFLLEKGSSEMLECHAICCVSGMPIMQGVPSKKILSKSMGDVAAILKSQSGFMSVESAACMKASKVLRGNLCAIPSRGIFPFVAQDSATAERPSWSALLRSIPEETECLMIFSDESKRRLWPFARLSFYGEQWRPFLNTGSSIPAHISRELQVSRKEFLSCLDCVEYIYSHGFSKQAIIDGLLDISSSKAIREHGIEYAQNAELQLAVWRGRDELLLAVFVAQKHELPTQETSETWNHKNCTAPQLALW